MTAEVEVTFIGHDGARQTGRVPEGESLMRAALLLDVPGILAECGGMCACATCHCYIEDGWAERLEPRSDMEEGMLLAALDTTRASRLSCQVTLTRELAGLVVRVPPRQA
ncbi:2Fe-2S iron-sulfur cluster-binding protein [Nonomuraea typhae]|uniref:2Fe-2S iron-sulfur cluster-binding protein n=1 Tax=Nonomuraea typhae TaxID=2603600 RepID=A0ABW7YRF2_9ACTN